MWMVEPTGNQQPRLRTENSEEKDVRLKSGTTSAVFPSKITFLIGLPKFFVTLPSGEWLSQEEKILCSLEEQLH